MDVPLLSCLSSFHCCSVPFKVPHDLADILKAHNHGPTTFLITSAVFVWVSMCVCVCVRVCVCVCACVHACVGMSLKALTMEMTLHTSNTHTQGISFFVKLLALSYYELVCSWVDQCSRKISVNSSNYIALATRRDRLSVLCTDYYSLLCVVVANSYNYGL